MDYVYTKSDSDRLLDLLKESGIKAEIIGTLPSNHDIDVLILSKPSEVQYLKTKIFKVVLGAQKVIETDIGTYFVRSSEFGGHVDVFFYDPRKKNRIERAIRERREGIHLG